MKQAPHPGINYIDAADVVEYLGISWKLFEKMIKNGLPQHPYVAGGRKYGINIDELNAYLDKQRLAEIDL